MQNEFARTARQFRQFEATSPLTPAREDLSHAEAAPAARQGERETTLRVRLLASRRIAKD